MLAVPLVLLLISLGQCAPPQLQSPTLSSNQPEEVVNESEVTLTCASETGDDDSKAYIFYKDRAVVRDASSDNTYTIGSLTPEDSGTYECHITTTVDGSSFSPYSNPYRLSVVYFPQTPSLTPNGLHEDVQIGSSLMMTCETRTGGPIIYTFYKHTPRGPAPVEVVQSSNSTTYTIQDFSLQDYALYTCTAAGPLLDTYARDSLLLLVPPQLQRTTLSSNQPEEVVSGAEVTMTCASETGDEDIKAYTFYKDLAIVRDASSDNTYTIESLTREDSGAYECEITTTANGSSFYPYSKQYRLSVVSFPYTPSLTPNGLHEDFQIGSSLTITCETRTGGPIIYNFYKHSPRKHTPGELVQSSNSTTYTIQDFSVQDYALYTCTAAGPFFRTYARDSLFLPLPAQLQRPTLSSNQPEEVVRGSEVTLTCEFETDDDDIKAYTFYKDLAIVRDASSDSTYTIGNLTSEDSGIYECEITTTASGSSYYPYSKLYRLSVVPFPHTPSLTPNGLHEDFQIGSSLTITCETRTGGSIIYNFYRHSAHDVKLVQSSDSTTYTIQDFSVQDYGLYTCIAAADPVHRTYARDSLFFPLPPQFQPPTLSSNQPEEVVNGSEVTLTCASETSDDDSKAYIFYRDRAIVRDASSDNTYTIRNLTPNDSATYECEITATASGSSLSLYSNPYELSVVSFPQTPILTPNGVYEDVQIGSTWTITCETTTGGSIIYNFYHHTSATQVDTVQSSNSTTYTIQHFTEQDRGLYTCTAAGPLLFTYARDSVLFLTPPQLTLSSNQPERVVNGSEVTLTCASETGDNDTKAYIFYKDRAIVRDASSDNTYTIRNLTWKDSATYECQIMTTVNGSSFTPYSNPYQLSVVSPSRLAMAGFWSIFG